VSLAEAVRSSTRSSPSLTPSLCITNWTMGSAMNSSMEASPRSQEDVSCMALLLVSQMHPCVLRNRQRKRETPSAWTRVLAPDVSWIDPDIGALMSHRKAPAPSKCHFSVDK
jgi:hypothetical protein